MSPATKAVAATTPEFPPAGVVPEDYIFEEAGVDGYPTSVRLSELFAPGKDTLVIYTPFVPDPYAFTDTEGCCGALFLAQNGCLSRWRVPSTTIGCYAKC